MTKKEEYIQKAIAEAKSTSGSTYAILALMEEVRELKEEIDAFRKVVDQRLLDGGGR